MPRVRVVEQEVPYEHLFKNMKSYPLVVVGFYSSVLANIASYGIKEVSVVARKINPEEIFNKERRKRVVDIYDHFSNNKAILVEHN